MPIVIALVSQKGGVGKSTLARAIAAVAARAGLRVKLVDLDPQQRTLVFWEKERQHNNVWPAIAIEALATSDGVSATAATDDLLILDMPGHVSEATLPVAMRAHLLVQPTGPSLDDLHPAAMTFHALVQCGVPRERLAFALCRLLSKAEEDKARAYLTRAGFAVLAGAIPERVAYREALDQGRSLTEIGSNDFNELVDAMMTELFRKVEEQVYSIGGPVAAHAREGIGRIGGLYAGH